jgi:hypothetical protein
MGATPVVSAPREEWQEVVLTRANARDELLFERPLMSKLGGQPPDAREADATFRSIRFRVNRRPIARNARALAEARGQVVPPELEVLASYDSWIIQYAVSAIEDRGLASVLSIGFQVELPNVDGVTVVDLLPQTQFISWFDGELRAEADVSFAGEARTASPAPRAPTGDSFAFGGGARLSVGGEAHVLGRLSFAVQTASVVAVGQGDVRSEWVLSRQQRPLVGDHLLFQTVLTPKHFSKLETKGRLYALVAGPMPFTRPRVSSDWIDLTCQLA